MIRSGISSAMRWSGFTVGPCGKKRRGQDWPGLIRRETEMDSVLWIFAYTTLALVLALCLVAAIVNRDDDWPG